VLATTNDRSAGVTCKHRDAAPVLFDRGASAPGQVRRLAGLNAKLAGGAAPEPRKYGGVGNGEC